MHSMKSVKVHDIHHAAGEDSRRQSYRKVTEASSSFTSPDASATRPACLPYDLYVPWLAESKAGASSVIVVQVVRHVNGRTGPTTLHQTLYCSTVRTLAATGGGGGGAIQAGAGSCSPTRPGRTISAMHILLRPRHVMSFVISWIVEVAPRRPHSYCISTTAVSPIAATSWWGKTEWLQQCRPAMRSRPCSSYSYMFAIRT